MTRGGKRLNAGRPAGQTEPKITISWRITESEKIRLQEVLKKMREENK